MTRVVLLLAALRCVAVGGSVECWPRFRGPNGSGLAPSAPIPTQWGEKDYRWKVALPGKGHSSPVVWGERLFVTSGLKDGTRVVTCLSVRDGRKLWERRFPSKPHSMNPLNSYATSTPALDAERIYLYWATPEAVTVVALDHDGNDVWQRNLGPFDSQHGGGVSPIVFDDLLVVPNDQRGKSFIIALDCRTGETRWKLDRRSVKAAYSTPCIYQPKDGPPELILTSTSHGVTSVDPRTGKVNWEFPRAFPLRVVSSPVVACGLIVGTCGVGGSGRRLVAVRPGSRDGRKPQLAYELKKNVPYVPTPIAVGDLLFTLAENGTVTCVRAATGERVWQGRLGGRFYGSFVHVDGRLYAISRKGEVFVIAASEKFELLGRTPLGEPSQATPAVAGGRMFLRTFSHLFCIGAP